MASHLASDEQASALASLDEARRIPLQLQGSNMKLDPNNRAIGGKRKPHQFVAKLPNQVCGHFGSSGHCGSKSVEQ